MNNITINIPRGAAAIMTYFKAMGSRPILLADAFATVY